jgi:hypothetical protein
MGFGETVFPFQMIFASGKYINGISYSSDIRHHRVHKKNIPLRDGKARRRLRSIFDRML